MQSARIKAFNMSDESRHRVRRGRPMRSVQSTEARCRSNARGAAANANRKRNPAPTWDADDAIARLRVILADVYGPKRKAT